MAHKKTHNPKKVVLMVDGGDLIICIPLAAYSGIPDFGDKFPTPEFVPAKGCEGGYGPVLADK